MLLAFSPQMASCSAFMSSVRPYGHHLPKAASQLEGETERRWLPVPANQHRYEHRGLLPA